MTPQTSSHSRPALKWPPLYAPPAAQEQRVELLPFTVEQVANARDLRAAVRVRQAAYARHLPELAARLGEPEAADEAPGTVVLLARSKLDGEPLGSLRMQTNAEDQLPLEASVELPLRLRCLRLAEVTRLGVTHQAVGRLVSVALFKTAFFLARALDVQSVVVAARSGLDRYYQRLLFGEVFPGQEPVPMRHAAMVPHRIYEFDIERGEQLWKAAAHPLLQFMVETQHPDLDISEPQSDRQQSWPAGHLVAQFVRSARAPGGPGQSRPPSGR